MKTRQYIYRKFMIALRDFASHRMFNILSRYVHGDVLDVGGWDFFRTIKNRNNITFNRWTLLEKEVDLSIVDDDPRFKSLQGNGCDMAFLSGTFDTVLCLQVLEHIYDPLQMVREIVRVLKPGGTAILMMPGTSNLHMAPDHYYNFTRYWIVETANHVGANLVEMDYLGGAWSSAASRLFYYALQMFRAKGRTYPDVKRNLWFYLLSPFMLIYILVNIPICLLFAFGDMKEEPNNYICVITKRTGS